MPVGFSRFLSERGRTDSVSRDLSSLCHPGHPRGTRQTQPHSEEDFSFQLKKHFGFRLLWWGLFGWLVLFFFLMSDFLALSKNPKRFF